MIIALMGSETDPQIQHMYRRLMEAGASPWIADTSQLGAQWTISFDANNYTGSIRIGSQQLHFADIHSVYWHRFLTPPTTAKAHRSAATDVTSSLECWFHYRNTRWVNGLNAIRYHQCKPAQLYQASRLGVPIPATWIGNDIEAASGFIRQHGAVILKPVHGGATAIRQCAADGASLAIRLQQSPATLQSYVPGTNIRSYVIGNTVFHIELATRHVDFRTDEGVLPEIVDVPESITRQSRLLCRTFGMHWCAIDWRRTTDDQYAFLEANPCPYFLFVEMTTGVDISGALIAQLLA